MTDHTFVMAGHRRSKNGVASLACDPAIHALLRTCTSDVDHRDKPGDDDGGCGLASSYLFNIRVAASRNDRPVRRQISRRTAFQCSCASRGRARREQGSLTRSMCL
jgi:hypothetical protein